MHRLLFLLAAAPLLQESPLREYYRFPVETKWTYDRTEAEKTVRVVMEILEVGEKSVTINTQVVDGAKAPTQTYFESGKFLVFGAAPSGRSKIKGYRILKNGSKKGDTWDATEGDSGPLKATAEDLGETKVTVPAGTYESARHTRITIPMKGGALVLDFHVVPGVGLVRSRTAIGDRETLLLELRSFRKSE